jgi:hypothetical protein
MAGIVANSELLQRGKTPSKLDRRGTRRHMRPVLPKQWELGMPFEIVFAP